MNYIPMNCIKLTNQQYILFKILQEKGSLTLGELRYEFYERHKPKRQEGIGAFRCPMKRNSRMSGWLNRLQEKGLIYIDYNLIEPWKYSLTNKALQLVS